MLLKTASLWQVRLLPSCEGSREADEGGRDLIRRKPPKFCVVKHLSLFFPLKTVS